MADDAAAYLQGQNFMINFWALTVWNVKRSYFRLNVKHFFIHEILGVVGVGLCWKKKENCENKKKSLKTELKEMMI